MTTTLLPTSAEERLRVLRSEARWHDVPWRGRSLRYLARGHGSETLLVLPGMTGGPELAALLLSGTLPEFRVVVPAHPPVETLAETVESLDAVLAHAQADRVHVLGKSYGGFVAQTYVRARPDRVASLALYVTAVPDHTRLGKHARARWLLHNLPWSVVRSGIRAVAVRTARQMPTERPFWESYFRDVCFPQDRAEVLALHERITDFDAGPAYTSADLAT